MEARILGTDGWLSLARLKKKAELVPWAKTQPTAVLFPRLDRLDLHKGFFDYGMDSLWISVRRIFETLMYHMNSVADLSGISMSKRTSKLQRIDSMRGSKNKRSFKVLI